LTGAAAATPLITKVITERNRRPFLAGFRVLRATARGGRCGPVLSSNMSILRLVDYDFDTLTRYRSPLRPYPAQSPY
jgi:hypothetical protein